MDYSLKKTKSVVLNYVCAHPVWHTILMNTKAVIFAENQLLMMPITTNDSLLDFLGKFPMTHEHLREAQRYNIQLDVASFDCQWLSQKLREIERKDLYSQAAFWLRIYTEENNHQLAREQLESMNVAYGYYVDGQPRRIDEGNPQEAQQSLDFTINLNKCEWYSKEVALFPVYWKFLCQDFLSKNELPWISWNRYAFVVRNWIPNNRIEKIWKILALF